MRPGDWIWRTRGKGEDLQSVYLLLWLECPVGSQGTPARVGGWDKVLNVGGRLGGEDLCDPLEMKANGEERLQQVVC